MGLFDLVLNAINDSDKEANMGQLAGIVNTVQQLSDNNMVDPSTIQSALSVVSNYTRSSLQEKRSNEGESEVENLINQFAGTQADDQILQTLFSTPQIQQIIEEIENKTGIDQNIIQGMLPVLVPLVLNFLKTGSNSNNTLGNSVLSSFLDADGDGDMDIVDAIQMASKMM